MNQTKETNSGLYEGVRGIAVKILNRIGRTDAYLDKLLEHELKNTSLSGQDKALLFEIVHGVVRWMGRIDWILTGFYKGQFSKSIANIKNTLRVALYQILFLDKVPDYAAVNEAVEFIKKFQGQKAADLTNAILRNIIRNKENIRFADRNDDEVAYLSAYYSHPSWMVKRWIKLFGVDFTENLLKANLQKPKITLRVNRLVTSVERVKELLNEVELNFTQGTFLKNFIKLSSLTNITDWEYFKKGYFAVQDESTGFACELLEPKAGMRIVDLCAAPGGKTAYISELMENRGELVAIDRFESRLKILRKNLKRMNVKNVRTIAIDALEFKESGFDRVLVDVPCSGLGTLTKKPDIKWKRELLDIRNLTHLQYDLLEKGAEILKTGGILIYSTCTIEPEENFGIISKFLKEHPEFKLVHQHPGFDDSLFDENGCLQTYPNVQNMDGAFVAKLIKTNSGY